MRKIQIFCFVKLIAHYLVYIFVDESGEIGLSNKSRRYFVLGFVYCKNPSILRNKLTDYLRRCHKNNRYPYTIEELKFSFSRSKLIERGYNEGDLIRFNSFLPKIKEEMCTIMAEYSDGIFVSIIDKTTIGARTWCPERLGNYVFAHTVYENILNNLNLGNNARLIYDAGRLSKPNEHDFNDYVRERARGPGDNPISEIS